MKIFLNNLITFFNLLFLLIKHVEMQMLYKIT